MRRYASIIGTVAVIILLLGLGFYIRYRSAGTNPEPEAGGSLPATNVDFTGDDAEDKTPLGSAAGTFKKSGDAEVEAFYALSSDAFLYLEPSGRIIRSVSGGEEVLSSSPLESIRSAKFSFDGKYLLVGYGKTPQWSVFNIEKKSWLPLGGATLSAAWAPADKRVAYVSKSGIEVIDVSANAPKPQLISKTSLADAELSWPAPNMLLISDRPTADMTASIWSLDPKTKNVSVLGEYIAYHGIWNSDGSRGIVFKGLPRGRGGSLYQTDAKGGEKQFSFLTLPSKCAFFKEAVSPAAATSSSIRPAATSTIREFLACAVPGDQDRLFAEALPDAWFQRSLFASDGLYKIDPLTGGITSLIARSEIPFDADQLQMQSGRLFFRNRLDQKIYSVSKD